MNYKNTKENISYFLHSPVITGVRSAVITEVSETKRFETLSSMKRTSTLTLSSPC